MCDVREFPVFGGQFAVESLLDAESTRFINAANTVLDQMQKAQRPVNSSMRRNCNAAWKLASSAAGAISIWCVPSARCPLVDFAITNSDEANIPKSSVDKIYELIDADLTAAEGLPRRWESKYIGRVTYGAARALHARLTASAVCGRRCIRLPRM